MIEHAYSIDECAVLYRAIAERRDMRYFSGGEVAPELLGEHGLAPQGGTALFRWVVSMRAHTLRDHLARQGILVRLFDTPASPRFGLPSGEQGWERLEHGLCTFNQMESLR